jgi:hypothetical protein
MIVGEGGWRPGEQQDKRFPMVTQTLDRDYLLAVYHWFDSSTLSDGKSLPDYLFAYSAWIISDPNDQAAWFDSGAGDRQLLIQAIANLSPGVRKFSWDHP